jgi:hypothetical protein
MAPAMHIVTKPDAQSPIRDTWLDTDDAPRGPHAIDGGAPSAGGVAHPDSDTGAMGRPSSGLLRHGSVLAVTSCMPPRKIGRPTQPPERHGCPSL